MVAAENGHTETAEVLLREGADASVQNKVCITYMYMYICTFVIPNE